MSNVQTDADRQPHDLSHLLFTAGKIGRLMTIGRTYVLPGDSYEQNLVGSLRMSALRRGLAVDSKADICSFYIPFRHIYGDQWVDMIKKGVDAPYFDSKDEWNTGTPSFLGVNGRWSSELTQTQTHQHVRKAYENIWNNYFKTPYKPDQTFPPTGGNLDNNSLLWGAKCCHIKTLWSQPVPERATTNASYTVSGSSIDLSNLNETYAKLHSDEERAFFMQRYRDVIRDSGGSTHYDADSRPHLLKRTEFWASGYDVNGTDQSSLGQFTGRVQQSFKHQVPRFFVPEHGMIVTVALVRFPSTNSAERNYLDGGRDKTINYFDFAGDSLLIGNTPPAEYRVNDFFSVLVSDTEKIKLAAGQMHRYAPDWVHNRYHELQGFPFMNYTPTGEDERLYIKPESYDEVFQTDQLGHWNVQARNNVNILRELPTARDSMMTS